MSTQPASKPHKLTLRGKHFPFFDQLPPTGEIPDFGGWMLLAQVKLDMSLGMRRVYRCRDKQGKEFTIAFYYDNGVPIPKVSVGNTICIDMPMKHMFLDGQVGVRLEDPDDVTVLKCSLDELFELNKTLAKAPTEAVCQKCGVAEPKSRCAKCTTRYCSKECQVADWAEKHKKQCGPISVLKAWNYTYPPESS